MKKKIVLIIFLLIFLSGLFCTGKGIFIWVKACLAQVLLENSWENVVKGTSVKTTIGPHHSLSPNCGFIRGGKGNVKPWPWADFTPVACLLFPGYRYRTIVVNSASGTSLAFAPGHLDGSAAPGSSGNCIIFGHRETHFRILQDLKMGDRIRLSLADGRVKEYQVAGIRIIDHNDIHRIIRIDEVRMTLITCYPFNSLLPGDSRFVVIAKEVHEQ